MSLSNSDNVKKVRVGICDQLIDGRYLNAVDSDFLESVLQDVQNFHDKCIQSSILVFPPFNNYRRFLIHKLVEDNFDNLSTFSIGHSSGRRTVVCYEEQLLSKESVSDSSCVTATDTMGVQKQSDSNEDQDPKVAINCPERKKVRALPDVAIYRPPALRKSDGGPSPSNVNERKPRASKQRRPDIPVYVPRALRGVQKPSAPPKSSTASGFIDKPQSVSSCEPERNVEDTILPSQNGKMSVEKKISSQSSEAAADTSSRTEESPHPPQSPDSSLESQTMLDSSRMNFSPSSSTPAVNISSPAESCMKDEEIADINASSTVLAEKIKELEKPVEDSLTVTRKENIFNEDMKEGDDKMECVPSEAMENCVMYEQFSVAKGAEIDVSLAKEKSIGVPLQSEEDEMVSSKSSLRTQEISEKNRSPILRDINGSHNREVSVQSKRKNNDGTLIGASDSQGCVRVNDSVGLGKLVTDGTCENASQDDSLPLSSWEDLFELPVEHTVVSKTGDNKTHKLIEEVVTAVGKVSVLEKPKCNYSQYRTDNVNFLSELSHVVEIYGFPSEFKTQDLISVLSPFGGGNSCAPAFEIKWVDDTHALAVFASSFVAADVLNLNHPLVKTRPLDESSAASKAKARKTCESLRIPFRPRPETCPALAQRLITGALGVNRRQSKAEREEERRLLREAREKRRNAAKERDAAWEGTIASTL